MSLTLDATPGLTASFVALCGSARSFLGHSGSAFKCILNESHGAHSRHGSDGQKAPLSASSASKLVADVRSFLLEVETDPTSADILLEALDGQVRQGRITSGLCAACRNAGSKLGFRLGLHGE